MPEKNYKESWWYKIITCSALVKRFDSIIQFCKDLVDKTKPHSSHEAINITWGIGSFGFYWADHFIYNRTFTNQDYVFLAAMAGITTLSSLSSKKVDQNSLETKDGLTTDSTQQP